MGRRVIQEKRGYAIMGKRRSFAELVSKNFN